MIWACEMIVNCRARPRDRQSRHCVDQIASCQSDGSVRTMHARVSRVTDQAEPCLMSQDVADQNRPVQNWANLSIERGIVDLYARRVALAAEHRTADQQDALDRLVVTKPFGRPFTAQPSFPPDPAEDAGAQASGLAGLRRRLAGGTSPTRKFATS